MFVVVILLAIFALFKTEILSWAEEKYYSFQEDKEDLSQINERDYFSDFENSRYWEQKTFLLDKYAEDLGFIPAIDKQEKQFMVWRCGARRFSVDRKNNMVIGVVGDEWDDLVTQNGYVASGYSIKYGDQIIKNVDEETVIYFISGMLNLRKNDNLRDTTDDIRVDIEKYHIMSWAL